MIAAGGGETWIGGARKGAKTQSVSSGGDFFKVGKGIRGGGALLPLLPTSGAGVIRLPSHHGNKKEEGGDLTPR